MGLYRTKDYSDFSSKYHLPTIILYIYYLMESCSHSSNYTVEGASVRQRAWYSAGKIEEPSWGFWPVLSVTLYDRNKLACAGAQLMQALLSRLSPN